MRYLIAPVLILGVLVAGNLPKPVSVPLTYVEVPEIEASTVVDRFFTSEIHSASQRYGVDARLIATVIRVESGFNPRAVSRAGARGLMQLMPDTARRLGVRDSFNPRENIDGGVRHLRYLLDRYNGDVTLALAAYNAGEVAVDTYGGVPPYDETQQYVLRITARIQTYVNGR